MAVSAVLRHSAGRGDILAGQRGGESDGSGAVLLNPSSATWRKSSRSSANANCIEVSTDHPDLVHVRDSKNHGTGPMIANETRPPPPPMSRQS